MLSIKQYPGEYTATCRKKVKADIAAFKKLASVTGTFENSYFNNMVLVLEMMFIHRMWGREGKESNPLNEVRMITNSILTNNNKLLADSAIKYVPAKTVLKINLEQK